MKTKPGCDADELKMEHNDDRFFALAQATHEVVSHARADGGDDADKQIEHGDARIEPFEHNHSDESDGVEEPLPRRHYFAQDENTDERGEDGRQILDGDCGGQVHVLQGHEEAKERERAEGAARNEQRVVVSFPIELPARDRDAADDSRDEATKEDNLHRRNATELFHEDVHDREGECGQKHVGHAPAEQARSTGCGLSRLMHGRISCRFAGWAMPNFPTPMGLPLQRQHRASK